MTTVYGQGCNRDQYRHGFVPLDLKCVCVCWHASHVDKARKPLRLGAPCNSELVRGQFCEVRYGLVSSEPLRRASLEGGMYGRASHGGMYGIK
jgi:hypothetical protein